MGNNLDGDASAPVTHRKRNIIIAAVAAAVLVVGVSITGAVIANAHAEAEAQAAAEAAAEAEAEAQERADREAHEAALDDARSTMDEGEAFYLASESYGSSEDREQLREALDALAEALETSGLSTHDVNDARTAVSIAMLLIGTKEEHDAEVAEAAAKALDEEYETLAAGLEGNGMFLRYRGIEYCDYLHEFYEPESPTLWSQKDTATEIDVAAVRVYCPEFAPRMDFVLSGFFDGQHVVGQTIQPGTYRTVGGATDCYWERNDGSGNIIDNAFVTSAHNGLSVTIYSGEGFVSEGCGLWVPAE